LSTLAEIGRGLHVTRERVRQIEKRTVEDLADLAAGSAGRRCRKLGRRLGTAVPTDSAELAAGLEWARRDLGTVSSDLLDSLLLYLAGPYRLDEGWLVSKPKTARLRPDFRRM
jgi:hypothetical protein